MKKVMLVEDEELILQGMKNIIDWEALELRIIHLAHNGLEALEMQRQEPADIIVTDVNMPEMDGLTLLKKLRETDSAIRFIILTGYDEFEYAKKAISLDVEDYILKPINEEELEEALKNAVLKIEENNRKNTAVMDENTELFQFLTGKSQIKEPPAYLKKLFSEETEGCYFVSLMKLPVNSPGEIRLSGIVPSLLGEASGLSVFPLPPEEIFLLLSGKKEAEEAREYFSALLNRLEASQGISGFLTVSPPITSVKELQNAYETAKKLQKYLIIEGYGSCIDNSYIHSRTTKNAAVDSSHLHKLIFQKDKEGALRYLEDLFIHYIKEELSIDVFYQMSIKTAVILQDIKAEYQLSDKKKLRNLTEVIEKIYQAEDIFAVKTLFMSEIIEIIQYLHEEDSHYTPVVKQIMQEVQKNYKEDMNLKTLASKYRMNTSYLGQIFQKEVGCTFAQYLSNTKNSIAKDLILNTNLRMNEIAKEAGYLDTSYFYRKFKQCYGVSPASLREMKKY